MSIRYSVHVRVLVNNLLQLYLFIFCLFYYLSLFKTNEKYVPLRKQLLLKCYTSKTLFTLNILFHFTFLNNFSGRNKCTIFIEYLNI